MKKSFFACRPTAVWVALPSATSSVVPFIVCAQGPASAALNNGKACQSFDVEYKKYKQEKDLLGTRTVPAKDLVKPAVQTLKDDKDFREAHYKEKKDKTLVGKPFDPLG